MGTVPRGQVRAPTIFHHVVERITVRTISLARTYTLWTTILRWVDGDTYSGFISLGFHTYLGSVEDPIRIRCALIQAPELKAAGGTSAKAHAEEIAPLGERQCVSYRPDEYGRPLVDLILPDGRLFSDVMLESGHAVPYVRR